jgi:hypothetical protein
MHNFDKMFELVGAQIETTLTVLKVDSISVRSFAWEELKSHSREITHNVT